MLISEDILGTLKKIFQSDFTHKDFKYHNLLSPFLLVRLGTILQLTLGPFLSLQFTLYTASEYPVYRWISGGACRRRFGLQASNNSSKKYQKLS